MIYEDINHFIGMFLHRGLVGGGAFGGIPMNFNMNMGPFRFGPIGRMEIRGDSDDDGPPVGFPFAMDSDDDESDDGFLGLGLGLGLPDRNVRAISTTTTAAVRASNRGNANIIGIAPQRSRQFNPP